jgi:hypothetical protein
MPSADPPTCAAPPVNGTDEVGFESVDVPVAFGFDAPDAVGYEEVPFIDAADAVAARTATMESMENCMLIIVYVVGVLRRK